MKSNQIKPNQTKSNQDKVRHISGEMIDEMTRIVRSLSDEQEIDDLRRYPTGTLYCRICESLFKLPEIICEDNEFGKVKPLQSIEFHKDAEIWNAMACALIFTLITCDLIGVGFGEKYDTLSTRTRMNFDGKTIREICYELSRRLPNCGINYLSDTMMREFVRDLLRLAEILKVDVCEFIKRVGDE